MNLRYEREEIKKIDRGKMLEKCVKESVLLGRWGMR